MSHSARVCYLVVEDNEKSWKNDVGWGDSLRTKSGVYPG